MFLNKVKAEKENERPVYFVRFFPLYMHVYHDINVNKSILSGCQTGKYGSSCLHDCGSCLTNETCLSSDGTCGNGCAPGFDLSKDNKCKTGFYTFNCFLL